MLVFIVPLKSKRVSKSWPKVCQLFERSIRAICNQTSDQFRAIVVCNEKPDIAFDHPYIHYLSVEFPDAPEEKTRVARGLADKGRKVLSGLIEAQKFSPTHTMSVDADDCVSSRLAEYVNQHPEDNGWFLQKGYKYLNNTDFLYIKRQEFYRQTGTANILRYDLNDIPESPEFNRGCGYYLFHINHQDLKGKMANQGTPLNPLPFPGAVYVIGSGENMSANENKLSFNWLTRKRLTPKLADEFSLHKV